MEKVLNDQKGKELADKIARDSNVTLHECYQCGKCTAGCPMAEAMDVMPRQIVHSLQLGMSAEVLHSKSIWLCATCHTRVERCPHDINIPALMENSRMEAKKRGIVAVPEVDKFNTIFMEIVKRLGKSNEAILEGLYNVTSGHLLQDMNNAPKMLDKGIVKPELNWSTNSEEVKRIIDKCKKEEGK